MRLDLFLTHSQQAISRTQAQDLIREGHVFYKSESGDVLLKKVSFQVQEIDQKNIFVKANDLQKYVSRGGLKLEHALKFVKLNCSGKIALDVGQSTGGFTDCLLQFGVEKVVGIDVGHSQLHEKMKTNLKVVSLEGIHVNEIAENQNFLENSPPGGFDIVVVDVSFISLTKIMSRIKNFLKSDGEFLFLVKPQFELTKKDLDKNGIVKNSKSYALIQKQVELEARQIFGTVLSYFKSDTLGKDGNQEFFIYGRKTI